MRFLNALKNLARSLKRELRVYQLVLQDPETPRFPKFFLGLAVGYALMPFDLIPDWIPILGHLDDLIIVPLLMWVALRGIPKRVIARAREKA